MGAIIPKPFNFIQHKGSFAITSKTSVGGDFNRAISKLIEAFGRVGIKLNKNNNAQIVFVQNNVLAAEEYHLTVTGSGIKVAASTEAGAFYAVQTIKQLADTEVAVKSARLSVGCCEIKDKPRFAYRSFMLDECRHFFGKEVVKETLEMMALLKLNIFHWHLTEDQGWRIEIKKYPLLTQKGAIRKSTQLVPSNTSDELKPYGEGLYYTQEDIKEIVQYAKGLNINIVPEIDMPGHMVAAISCYPHLSCEGKPVEVAHKWGVMDVIGCVGGDNFLPFVKDVLDEVFALFPYEYIHIGGDEVPKTKWEKCPLCQAKIKEHNLGSENELQGWFNNQIADYAKSKNKKIIGWNEILEASVLSNDTVVQWWHGDLKKKGVLGWLQKGNKVILSPLNYLYADHLYSMKDLKKSYSVDLDTHDIPLELEQNILGIEIPLWTEFVRDIGKMHFNAYPRMVALAEINWTPKSNKDFADFEDRLAQFSKIMEAKGIGYAPRKYYLASGFKGWLRRTKAGADWRADANTEYKSYLKDKQ